MPAPRLEEEITHRLQPQFPTSERTAKWVSTNRADHLYTPRHAVREEHDHDEFVPEEGDTTTWMSSQWPVAGAPPAEIGDYTAAISGWHAERVETFPAWTPPPPPPSRWVRLKQRVAPFFVALGELFGRRP